jgi:rhomboid protease GluP
MFQSSLSFKGVTNWGTILLFAINIVIFLLALAIQSLPVRDSAAFALGGSFFEAIMGGQIWRLITANFLQLGIFHLGLNMFALYYYGNFIENYYGTRKLIIIYFISGVAGTALSLLYPNSITFGASASIWGFIGVMVGESVRSRIFSPGLPIDMKSQMGSILIWLFIGFTLPGVSGLGHLGGFVAGFVLGLILNTVNAFHISKTENTILNVLFYCISLAIFGSFILMFASMVI